MKIVFLHGLESSPNSTKATYLRSMGPDVVAPHGGAVAMVARPSVPLVLVAPAWSKYAPWATVSGDATILHSDKDDVVPIEDSEALSRTFGARLIQVGDGHRMSDPVALAAILDACKEAV